MTAYLMQFNGIKLIGGILLLWVTYKLYVDILKNKKDNKDIGKYKVKDTERGNFRSALITVVVADVTLSLDNVIKTIASIRPNINNV